MSSRPTATSPTMRADLTTIGDEGAASPPAAACSVGRPSFSWSRARVNRCRSAEWIVAHCAFGEEDSCGGIVERARDDHRWQGCGGVLEEGFPGREGDRAGAAEPSAEEQPD